jgi:hypothetical protein
MTLYLLAQMVAAGIKWLAVVDQSGVRQSDDPTNSLHLRRLRRYLSRRLISPPRSESSLPVKSNKAMTFGNKRAVDGRHALQAAGARMVAWHAALDFPTEPAYPSTFQNSSSSSEDMNYY